jgi:hypothetical protein
MNASSITELTRAPTLDELLAERLDAYRAGQAAA